MIDTPFELLSAAYDSAPRLSQGSGRGYVVVLADGEQPTHDVPLRLLQDAPFVVCCDGAIRHCDRADAVVGDGDSIPMQYRKEYATIFHQVDEQEDNDLTKATRYCLSKGFRRIVYLGATGRREDHALGNISLMVRYAAEMGVEPLLATNYGWFVPVCHPQNGAERQLFTRSFSSFHRQQVSLFNFGCTHLHTEGLCYDGYAYRSWWQGTLNEAAADHFSIMADGDYLVFRTYEAK